MLFHVNFYILLLPFLFVLLVIMCALYIVFNKTCLKVRGKRGGRRRDGIDACARRRGKGLYRYRGIGALVPGTVKPVRGEVEEMRGSGWRKRKGKSRNVGICVPSLEWRTNPKPMKSTRFILQETWDSPASTTDSIRLSSPPAHFHNSFPSGIAVKPDQQHALTYLNCERKVFWAVICLFPSSYPARYFRNEGFSLTGKEIELPWQPRA